MNEEITSIILKSFNEKKNSHAFLMETNDIDCCLTSIFELIKSINKDKINTTIDFNNEVVPDIKIVRPDGKEIKKEQVIEVINEFQTYPVVLDHRYYIIINSEVMNASSANVLLKFLEEPENSIVGFFITTNKRAMINTIVSRCQSYKMIYKTLDMNNESILSFIDAMDKKNMFNRIVYIDTFFTKDRAQNILTLKQIKNSLFTTLNSGSRMKEIIIKIKLVDECILRMNRNGNQDLIFLDLARKW